VPFGYPVFLELGGRRAVVIGGGAVRDGKVQGLLDAGAGQVLVVVPGPLGSLKLPTDHPRVLLENRAWEPIDLDGAFLCVAASSDPEERDAIARAGRDRGVLVNVMDDVPNCDFAAPAVVRRGDLLLAISTGGRSPALARRLREALGRQFGAEWEEIVEILHRVRDETLPLLPDLAERSKRWQAALDLDEAEELVRAGRGDELHQRLRDRLVGKGAA
jgi:precorrin-2 dehydrogenase